MDWAHAIDRNHTALARIVAALFAMVGLVAGGVMEKPPNAVRLAVLRILRPAESAVRRLIVIAAHGLVVKLRPPRPMPVGHKIPAKGSGSARAPAFQLFDSRKRFDLSGRKRRKAGPVPRVIVFNFDDIDDFDPLIPKFLRMRPAPAPVLPVPATKPGDTPSALGRRLAAIHAALSDIPKQGERLAHWRARRARMKEAKFREPLRQGPPPGHRKKPTHDVDHVLNECHSLARDLPPAPPPPNTS